MDNKTLEELQRAFAKTLRFSKLYGMSAEKLSTAGKLDQLTMTVMKNRQALEADWIGEEAETNAVQEWLQR